MSEGRVIDGLIGDAVPMIVDRDMNPGGLSPEAQVRLAQQGGSAEDLAPPALDDHRAVGVWRRLQHSAWGEGSEPGEPAHRPTMIGGVDCLVAGPAARRGAASLMWFHGGGFCLGSPGTDIPITARFAAALPVVSVDYALAPERPFPAARNDAFVVYREIARHGPVVLGGTSAGANLAVGLALQASEVGVRRPLGLVLLSPHLNFDTSRPLNALSTAYLGATDRADPAVSPLRAPEGALRDLPPTLIQVTSTESLHDDAVAFATRLDRAGTAVTLQVWNGLWHAWHYHRELPEAHDAVDRAARFLLAST